MAYELWQTRTRNLMGSFETQAEALEAVRSAITTYGADYFDTLVLGYEDDDGQSKMLARGEELVELAVDAYEHGERERELLRLLVRGECEIAAGVGYDLDQVLAEVDALLADDAV